MRKIEKECSEETFEQIKKECISRLEILNVHSNVIKDFKEEDKLNYSNPMGLLYWLEEEKQKWVDELEEKYSLLVYHVLETPTSFGTLYTMMYVRPEKQEWKRERKELKEHGYIFAYVHNKEQTQNSEFGTVVVEPCFLGGVRRTA